MKTIYLTLAECVEWAGHLTSSSYGNHADLLIALTTKNIYRLQQIAKNARWATRVNCSKAHYNNKSEQWNHRCRAREYAIIALLCREALISLSKNSN